MKKVLIIEDDQIVAHIYRNKFIIEGFQVEVAYTGEAGLELINSYRPDAVLLDLVLPKISGVELMNAVRAESQFKTLPLIVFSNTYLTNLVQEAWKAGATKCLSKASCTPKQVIDAVRSTLSLKDEAPKRSVNNPSPQPSAPVTPARPARAAVDAEAKFQTELHSAFVITLPTVLAALRASVKALAKADAEFTRIVHIEELYKRVHALTANANLAGLTIISQLSEAFEALLKELQEKPKLINSSTMRTVATAVDFLGVLFDQAVAAGGQAPATAQILVVDDEAISRRAVTSALERAKLKSTAVEDPKVAFKLLVEGHYDLIFLDVDMPEMNGFELCTKLRALPKYKSTPVVFVTSLNDFESRTSSMMSGGNDFIAKPFHFLELAVKALVYVLRGKFPVGKRN
jgi:DNA-binding response OmpR family regulator